MKLLPGKIFCQTSLGGSTVFSICVGTHEEQDLLRSACISVLELLSTLHQPVNCKSKGLKIPVHVDRQLWERVGRMRFSSVKLCGVRWALQMGWAGVVRTGLMPPSFLGVAITQQDFINVSVDTQQ